MVIEWPNGLAKPTLKAFKGPMEDMQPHDRSGDVPMLNKDPWSLAIRAARTESYRPALCLELPGLRLIHSGSNMTCPRPHLQAQPAKYITS